MNNDTTEQFEFKAEMKQLLHLIIHSLYTHPDVFLRELISNSSDALNKFRFERLTKQNVRSPELDLSIRITTNKEEGTISIEDFGVGLNKEDLINKLGCEFWNFRIFTSFKRTREESGFWRFNRSIWSWVLFSFYGNR